VTVSLNPRYYERFGRPAPGAPQPPFETGQRLATFPRGLQAEEELRVALCHYKGFPFVTLRVWEQDDQGQWWPVRGKGLSVRARECAGIAEALASVSELLALAGPENNDDYLHCDQGNGPDDQPASDRPATPC
jgi:hypothetical protein